MEMNQLSCRELMHFALYNSKSKRADQAILYLKHLIKIEPDNIDALFLLGSEYAEIGLINEGVEAMEKALLVAEEAHLVRFQLAMLNFSIGEKQKAIDGFEILEKLPETESLYHYAMGMLAVIEQQNKKGIDGIKKGLSLPTDNQPLHENMQALLDKIERAEDNNEEIIVPNNKDETASSQLFLSAYDQKQ